MLWLWARGHRCSGSCDSTTGGSLEKLAAVDCGVCACAAVQSVADGTFAFSQQNRCANRVALGWRGLVAAAVGSAAAWVVVGGWLRCGVAFEADSLGERDLLPVAVPVLPFAISWTIGFEILPVALSATCDLGSVAGATRVSGSATCGNWHGSRDHCSGGRDFERRDVALLLRADLAGMVRGRGDAAR